MIAPKVKVLTAVGKSERGSLRRGIGRNGVLQPGRRYLPLFLPQLSEQPRAMARAPHPASTAGAWALMLSPPDSSHPAETGTVPQTPANSHPLALLPHPGPISQPSCHSSSGSQNTTCVFPLSPPHTAPAPRARAPVSALQMLFQQAAISFLPSLLPLPLGSISRGPGEGK